MKRETHLLLGVWGLTIIGAVGLLFAVASAHGDRLDTIEQRLDERPIVLPAVIAPTQTYPRVLSYAEWRAQTPRSIATVEEAEVALIEAGMTHEDALTLASLAASCEAPVRDRDGQSIGINLNAVGDKDGRSRGAFQVNTVAHPWAADLYLFDLDIAASTSARIAREGRGLGEWSCTR